jgi:nitrate/TMAO reductase-like tetraheme cytochrome c subunit
MSNVLSTIPAALSRIRLMAALSVFLVAALFTGAAAARSVDTLSEADQACLACHSGQGLTKALASGETLALHVDPERFARSTHGVIGCSACHAQIRLPEHPGETREIANRREYTIASSETCRTCHERIFKTYEGSMHAARLRAGNVMAATCADCHRPHEVSPPSVQDGAKNVCTACHGGLTAVHDKWLPNAGRHLQAVACSACHAPNALKQVDLRLHDGAARERLVDRQGTLQFEKLARAADVNGDGLDALELRTLLAELNRDGRNVVLRGHIELRSGLEAHELPEKALARRECTHCHNVGAAPFQRVTVSVLDADERPLRYDAHKEVLTSVVTMDALRGFYAVGGTRIRGLDLLLGLVLVAGISVPILHLLLRRFFRGRDRSVR